MEKQKQVILFLARKPDALQETDLKNGNQSTLYDYILLDKFIPGLG